jgi:hypothetical protein
MIELVCESCGNNRFRFPADDHDPVTCEFCYDSLGTLGEVKARVADTISTGPILE